MDKPLRWHRGQADKRAAIQARGSEFKSPAPAEKSGIVACACNSSPGKGKTGGIRGLLAVSLDRPANSRFNKRLCLITDKQIMREEEKTGRPQELGST